MCFATKYIEQRHQVNHLLISHIDEVKSNDIQALKTKIRERNSDVESSETDQSHARTKDHYYIAAIALSGAISQREEEDMTFVQLIHIMAGPCRGSSQTKKSNPLTMQISTTTTTQPPFDSARLNSRADNIETKMITNMYEEECSKEEGGLKNFSGKCA
jgi:G3E family GTPase